MLQCVAYFNLQLPEKYCFVALFEHALKKVVFIFRRRLHFAGKKHVEQSRSPKRISVFQFSSLAFL
jgi:hypothetical protein